MLYWKRGMNAVARMLRLDLRHSQRHYAAALSSLLRPGDTWLDVGCGKQFAPAWAMGPDEQARLASRASLVVGLDLDSAMLEHPHLKARVAGRGEMLPFAAGTFDLLSANMVFEHLQDPEGVLREALRVLKQGGRLLLLTPNYNHYLIRVAALTPDFLKRRIVRLLEGRRSADIFPAFYRLNTMRRICDAAESCGLEVESIRTTIAPEFYALGPLGVLECFWLKLLSVAGNGRFDTALVATLRCPAAAPRAALEAGEPGYAAAPFGFRRDDHGLSAETR